MRVIPRERLKPDKGIPFTADHLRRLEKSGKFPKPINLGANRVAYLEDEIDAWLKSKAAERSGKAA